MEVVDTEDNIRNATPTRTIKQGVKFQVNSTDIVVKKVTKNTSCTATKCYLELASDGSVIASATFVSTEATFSTRLSAGVSYYAVVDSAGANYTSHEKSTAGTFPEVKTNITYTYGVYNNGDDAQPSNIASITSSTYEYDPSYVTVGTGGIGTRYIRNEYPVTEGLTAGTTKLPLKPNLEPEDTDLTDYKNRTGL